MHLAITTPQGLFNKVHFDIRMFFCRRGNENMHSMTKDMFQVNTDENTGRKVVKKVVDELTKNHRFDKETSSGIKPEIQGLYIFFNVLFINLVVKTSQLHRCLNLDSYLLGYIISLQV